MTMGQVALTVRAAGSEAQELESHMFRPAMIKSACIAAVLSSCLAASAMAEPNPEYVSWSKCKPGAAVTVKGNTEAMGQKSAQTIVTKLVEMTPEKAVVETTVTMEMMGQKMAQPAQKREVPSEVKMPKEGEHKIDPAMMEKMKAAQKDAKKGEDTITVAGKEVKCTTTEAAFEQNGIKSTTKSWNSTEIPGGMVKVEVNTSGSMASKSTMEVVEFTDGN
ncbi:MAG: hypothetical protein JWM57_1108 [Phycisphaerales bacterium]|nr:hypothetical protein [Phycisphaerales bacterium]